MKMNTQSIDPKDPKFIGFWTKCIRETSLWSQEALAASSGLDVRTIQRIEAGKPTSITTRRALARGLGYDNLDIFDAPEFLKSVHDLFEGLQKVQDDAIQQQFPDQIRLKVSRVVSGEALGRIAYESEAYFFNADDATTTAAKEVAATLFDYLHDLGDIASDLSFTDKLSYNSELGEMLGQLEGLDAICYAGSRTIKMVGENRVSKAPMTLTVGYLIAVPKDRVVTEIMAPRRLS
jgi:transcriptional regulator with XRE-family HTH domain